MVIDGCGGCVGVVIFSFGRTSQLLLYFSVLAGIPEDRVILDKQVWKHETITGPFSQDEVDHFLKHGPNLRCNKQFRKVNYLFLLSTIWILRNKIIFKAALCNKLSFINHIKRVSQIGLHRSRQGRLNFVLADRFSNAFCISLHHFKSCFVVGLSIPCSNDNHFTYIK